MAISREAVVWGFRLVLGREPESEEGIRAHMGIADESALVETLLRSAEFQNSRRFEHVVRVLPDARHERAAAWPYARRASLRIVVFGNCQVAGIGQLLQAMVGDGFVQTHETTPAMLARLRSGEFDLAAALGKADLILVQMAGEVTRAIQERCPAMASRVRQFPPIVYGGFHPDIVYVARSGGGHLQGPMGEYQSSIALWAWLNDLDVDQAAALYRPEVFEALGFDRYHDAAHRALLRHGASAQLPLEPLIDSWATRGCWMHSVNHPKLFVLADVAAAVLRREGIEPIRGVAEWVPDGLSQWPVWPVYPGLAERSNLEGSLAFKLDRGFCPNRQPVLTMDLPAFLEASFRVFESAGREALSCERVQSEPYAGLRPFVGARPTLWKRWSQALGSRLQRSAAPPPAQAHPYVDLPDSRYWRRAVSQVPRADVDPVLLTSFDISPTDRVATAGSCFAQHIARTLRREGFAYWVVDDQPALPEAERERRQFGVFSARYGNLYTARQLVQLFDRAHDALRPLDSAWRRADGRYVDPFRPHIEPGGFHAPTDVEQARAHHLADVRRMFSELDVFVFTLGLTEAWRRREDGMVFPLAPGVAGGQFDPALYEFINFDANEVRADMLGFVRRLRGVNPGARVILTVSPVPLIATYEDRHVLVSTAYSKAALRVAAGQVSDAEPQVDYFPSFEIITGPHAGADYFEADRRSVSAAGVDHAMRVFMSHYARGAHRTAARSDIVDTTALAAEQARLADVICDEEAIDRHRGG